jgi:hypothetical protein
MQQDKSIFIGGLQRSGTSLMRAIIGSHPEIAIFQWDLQLWTKFYDQYKDKDLSDAVVADDLVNKIADSPKMRACDLPIKAEVIKQRIKQEKKVRCDVIFRLFLEEYAKQAGKQIWGLKTPHNEFVATEILQSYPNAKFIHMIRDPRDVAVSFQSYGDGQWLKNYIPPEHIKQWQESFRVSQKNLNTFPSRYLVIKYETLVEFPESTIKSVCNFLEITFDEKMITEPNHPGWKGHNSFLMEDLNQPSEITILKTPVGRYKKKLPERLIFLYQKELLQELKSFNYHIEPFDSNSLKCFYYKIINKIINKRIFLRIKEKISSFPSKVKRKIDLMLK